jgi:putative transposase
VSQLFINALLEWKVSETDRYLQRVLWIDNAQNKVILIQIPAKKHLPYVQDLRQLQEKMRQGYCILLTADPYLATQDRDYLTEKQVRFRDQAWTVICKLLGDIPSQIFDSAIRGKRIKALLTEKQFAKPTIYAYLRNYWQGGQTKQALVPQFKQRGGRGKIREVSENAPKRGRPVLIETESPRQYGINITSVERDKIIAGAIKYFEKKKLTMRDAYNATLDDFFREGYEMTNAGQLEVVIPVPEKRVSFDQFVYWYKRENRTIEAVRSRIGKRKFNLQYRELLGNATSLAYGPGSLFQIDSTVYDIHLVSVRDRTLVVGRPIVYVAVDTFSRLVVGFFCTTENASWRSAIFALENVVSEKSMYCESIGVKGVTQEMWPSSHLPSAIIADNAEFDTFSSDQLTEIFGIRLDNTPPYRADWKPFVERAFLQLNQSTVSRLPGKVTTKERGDRDSRQDAAITLPALRRILALAFLSYNGLADIEDYPRDANMIADRVPANPLRLWDWGIENRTGQQRFYPPDVIRTHLLPRGKASVTAFGVEFKGLNFYSPVLEKAGWFTKARIVGSTEVKVSFDPITTAGIYLHVLESDGLDLTGIEVLRVRDLILVPLKVIEERGFEKNMSWEDMDAVLSNERLERRAQKARSLQDKIRLTSRIDAIATQEIKATKDALKQKSNQSKHLV